MDTVLRLLQKADGLIEGNRPGVMERLGLGPDVCLTHNPALVYGRMTGWGQEGPMAQEAGHDINYVALSGALYPIGRRGEKPAIPLNLVGDFGGGGLWLAYGMVCALLEAKSSGQGQVVDAAMIDGAATLMASTFAAQQAEFWSEERGYQSAGLWLSFLRGIRDQRRQIRLPGVYRTAVLRRPAGKAWRRRGAF